MSTAKPRIARFVSVGAAAAIAAASVNAAVFGLGRAADVAYVVARTSKGPNVINLADVVGLSIMTFAVGLLAAIVASRAGRPSLRSLQLLGAVLAVASTSMDLSIKSTVAAKGSLAAMHIIVGIAYVAGLRLVGSAEAEAVATSTSETPAVDASFGWAAA